MLIGIAPFMALAGCEVSPGILAREETLEYIRPYIDKAMTGWYQFLSDIYQGMVNVVLYTPEALLTNPQVSHLWWIFVTIAIGIISVITVIEGIKIILGWSQTNLMQLIGRTAVAFCAMAFILPVMTYGLKVVNDLVAYFLNLAHNQMSPADYLQNVIAETFTTSELPATIIFFVLLIFYLFKILLYYGRRWFDIIVAAIISPLAFTATIFDSTAHYFQVWWKHVVQLYMIQLVHAVYLTIIALIILSPGPLTGTVDAFIRILILIGALWRMSTPPKFVSQMSASPDSRNMVKDVAKQILKFKTGVKKA